MSMGSGVHMYRLSLKLFRLMQPRCLSPKVKNISRFLALITLSGYSFKLSFDVLLFQCCKTIKQCIQENTMIMIIFMQKK